MAIHLPFGPFFFMLCSILPAARVGSRFFAFMANRNRKKNGGRILLVWGPQSQYGRDRVARD